MMTTPLFPAAFQLCPAQATDATAVGAFVRSLSRRPGRALRSRGVTVSLASGGEMVQSACP